MIFLPFIENGFKHSNLNSHDQRLNISILGKSNELLFSCVNTVYEKKKDIDKKGSGIELVKKRLELLYPQHHNLNIKQTGNEYSVTLKINLSDD